MKRRNDLAAGAQIRLRFHAMNSCVCALLMTVGASPFAASQEASVPVSPADVVSALALVPGSIPAELAGVNAATAGNAWEGWLARRREEMRRRLEQGDEDSLVNLWMYGTSFTKWPAVGTKELADQVRTDELLNARLNDFLDGIASPRGNERLAVGRSLVEGRGIDAATPQGREQLRDTLLAARARALEEFRRTDRVLASARQSGVSGAEVAAHATIFQKRGLSSDTSVLVNFAVERALIQLKTAKVFEPSSIQRVAIVGPGLDFVNKADGHDVYSQQTIQPFAIIDSLRHLGLAAQGLRVVTLDINPRVTRHIQEARERANRGARYVLHLPLSTDEQWTNDLRLYWHRAGHNIGQTRPSLRPLTDTKVRVIDVGSDVVMSVVPQSLDIVSERLAVLNGDVFDMVIATNVFVYYDEFEQALAMLNVARMLRPNGVLLANTNVAAAPLMRPQVGYLPVIYSERQGDIVFVSQRQ